MNKPPSDYNAIKSLVENNENNIEKISNNIQPKNVKLIPHQKKNKITFRKYIISKFKYISNG